MLQSPGPSPFYYLRHGQTDANLQGVMCGSGWDIELNQTGIAQAEAAARYLLRHLPEVGTICASPLRRARRTAEIVAGHYGASVHFIEELREWDMGSWSRRPFAEVREAFLGSGEPELGESRAALRERALRAFTQLAGLPGPVLVVSHGGLWMGLQEALSIPATRLENGIPYKVQRAGQVWQAGPLGEE